MPSSGSGLARTLNMTDSSGISKRPTRPTYHPPSIDAVRLSGPGVWHRHTSGEVDLCFASGDEPRFDGQAEGWVVFSPGSDHVPTVEGGTMDILYFIPGGQLQWKRE